MLFVQWDNDLAVGVGLERVFLCELLAQDLVVVDLAVDGKGDGLVLVGDGLCARVWWRAFLALASGMSHSRW